MCKHFTKTNEFGYAPYGDGFCVHPKTIKDKYPIVSDRNGVRHELEVKNEDICWGARRFEPKDIK